MISRFLSALFALVLAATTQAAGELPFSVEVVADFDEPWAVEMLPDGRLLVTEKKGNVFIVKPDGTRSQPVSGLPDADYGGQGGMGDVALHPDYADNGMVYFSYAESGVGGTRGAAVARGVLDSDAERPKLDKVEVIWRQYPKVLGRGHFGHRLLFDDAGYLWITSGDRQKFTPAQDMQANLGKMLRLNADGTVPDDNPFVNYLADNPLVDDEAVYGEIWSLGHRNPLGVALDLDGRLWEIEMGPAGGDELNLIERGANYGYPTVSNGKHYDGREMPDHDTRPEFAAPAASWTPVISPGDMIVYGGKLFPTWRGNALVAGLSSEAIVRVELGEKEAKEVERYPMGARIRSLAEDPSGAIWVLEDERKGSKGRLLKLTPAKQ